MRSAAEIEAMGVLLSMLVGAGIAAAIILVFWLLLNLADDARRRAERPF